MAGNGKPSMVMAAAFVVACGLAALAPTAAMAQIPFMIPNFNFGPQHYRGSSHYSTRSHARHEEDKTAPAADKSKEKDATEPTASTSAQHTQQMTSAPASHDAAPSGGSGTPASPPPAAPAKQNNDDQPAFQPSR